MIYKNKIYVKKLYCEPFFSKYKLIRSTRMRANNFEKELFDLAAYVDKNYDETELSKLLRKSKEDVVKNFKFLIKKTLLRNFIKLMHFITSNFNLIETNSAWSKLKK